MTTIPASVKAQLDADWTGAGGVEPAYYVGEDFRTDPPLGENAVWISDDLQTDPRPVNETFVDEYHTLTMTVNAVSADRLKELSDEVVRILNATAIANVTYQRYKARRNVSGVDYKGIWTYQEIITYDLREHMKSAAAAYGAGTGPALTQAQLEDAIMYGSANAAYVPAVPFFYNFTSWDAAGGPSIFRNTGADDISFVLALPMPTVKGSLKLYITAVRVEITTADADDYVSRVKLYIVRDDDTTLVINDGTARQSAGTYEYAPYNQDCSAHTSVMLAVDTFCTDVFGLVIQSLAVKCHYDT